MLWRLPDRVERLLALLDRLDTLPDAGALLAASALVEGGVEHGAWIAAALHLCRTERTGRGRRGAPR